MGRVRASWWPVCARSHTHGELCLVYSWIFCFGLQVCFLSTRKMRTLLVTTVYGFFAISSVFACIHTSVDKISLYIGKIVVCSVILTCFHYYELTLSVIAIVAVSATFKLISCSLARSRDNHLYLGANSVNFILGISWLDQHSKHIPVQNQILSFIFWNIRRNVSKRTCETSHLQ